MLSIIKLKLRKRRELNLLESCKSCIKSDVCYKKEGCIGCSHYISNDLIEKVKKIVFSNDFPENKEDDLMLLFTREGDTE